MKTNKWFYAIMIASLVWVACDDDDNDKIIDPALNDTDELFVEKAARAHMVEIETSEIAVTKATDSLVRNSAQQMITDHTQAKNELEDIADDFRGVEWPNDLDEGHEAVRDQLDSVASGYAFDTLYMSVQKRLHVAAKETFETATSTTTELRLRSYATKYLPHIEEHLKTADSLSVIVMGNDDGTMDGN